MFSFPCSCCIEMLCRQLFLFRGIKNIDPSSTSTTTSRRYAILGGVTVCRRVVVWVWCPAMVTWVCAVRMSKTRRIPSRSPWGVTQNDSNSKQAIVFAKNAPCRRTCFRCYLRADEAVCFYFFSLALCLLATSTSRSPIV